MYVPQWQERLGWKLFPQKHVDFPALKGTQRDGIVCRTVTHFSIIDRIRILVSGKVEVTTKTSTENELGENKTCGEAVVMPPRWLSR